MNAPVKSAKMTQIRDEFVARVGNRTAVVGVIGLGYVGLPLAEAFLNSGFPVIGFDVDVSKIDQLGAGKSYIKHISDERIGKMNSSGRFQATTAFEQLKDADAILICVPTPLDHHRDPDLSFVVDTTEMIGRHLRPGHLVVLESTTYPGTTDEVMRVILEKSGLKGDEDFALAYSPEREDPGNPKFETSTIPKIVGALSPDCADMAEALYRAIVPKVVRVSDARTAEAVKLTENIFRAVNIALANELKVVFGAMDIDVWEVIDAADTKPFGFMAFYPGPGLGGHCIPIDPFYLTWKARAYGLHTRFIELAGEINNFMPGRVIEMTARAMNDQLGKAMKGSRILVAGAAYKKNVDDMRESPSLVLIERLLARGAHVDYYDPYIPVIPMTREHASLAGMTSCAWDKATLSSYDTVIISTDHDNVDYDLLLEAVPLIVDTRNAMKSVSGSARDKIVKA